MKGCVSGDCGGEDIRGERLGVEKTGKKRTSRLNGSATCEGQAVVVEQQQDDSRALLADPSYLDHTQTISAKAG